VGRLRIQRAAKALGVPGPVTIQNSYSLLSRGVDNDLAETLFRENMSLLAYSPLGGGMLSGKYLGGVKPPNARYSLFDGLGLRFRKPIVHEAVRSLRRSCAGRLGISLVCNSRIGFREEPVASPAR
jgi:aryl-alcohol dehydrogenase-like predicted oxidoreductase